MLLCKTARMDGYDDESRAEARRVSVNADWLINAPPGMFMSLRPVDGAGRELSASGLGL